MVINFSLNKGQKTQWFSSIDVLNAPSANRITETTVKCVAKRNPYSPPLRMKR